MVGRYGEFLLVVVMLLTATVAVAVAMQTAAQGDVGPRDVQYTVEASLFVDDTENRTLVAYGNLTGVQQAEFDRARNGTISTETRPELLEYAGYPYLIERDGLTYEVVIYVYD